MKIFNDSILKVLIGFTLIFNVIDICVTVKFIKYGGYKENNPFMNYFLKMEGIMPFVLIKTLLICAGIYLLYKRRDYLIARLGIYLCFCFYWALIAHFYYFLWCK